MTLVGTASDEATVKILGQSAHKGKLACPIPLLTLEADCLSLVCVEGAGQLSYKYKDTL